MDAEDIGVKLHFDFIVAMKTRSDEILSKQGIRRSRILIPYMSSYRPVFGVPHGLLFVDVRPPPTSPDKLTPRGPVLSQ